MNCSCTHCGTVYRIDPAKVPAGGIRARCARCTGVFEVGKEGALATAAVAAAQEPGDHSSLEPQAATATEPPARVGASPFGAADPHSRARRLARALVSDIVVYHPERRERSLREGTVRTEFREEIRKSWEEYVGQVGEEMARRSPYFREALNEILAAGRQVF